MQLQPRTTEHIKTVGRGTQLPGIRNLLAISPCTARQRLDIVMATQFLNDLKPNWCHLGVLLPWGVCLVSLGKWFVSSEIHMKHWHFIDQRINLLIEELIGRLHTMKKLLVAAVMYFILHKSYCRLKFFTCSYGQPTKGLNFWEFLKMWVWSTHSRMFWSCLRLDDFFGHTLASVCVTVFWSHHSDSL